MINKIAYERKYEIVKRKRKQEIKRRNVQNNKIKIIKNRRSGAYGIRKEKYNFKYTTQNEPKSCCPPATASTKSHLFC